MKQGIVIVLVSFSLKIAQLLKETYFFGYYETSDVYSEFISSKASLDLLLIPFSSVYFYEQTLKDNLLQIPIAIIAIFATVASIVLYNSDFVEVQLLVLAQSILAVFSNSLVVLSKELRSTKLNILINGFEHYIVAGLIVLMYIIRFSTRVEFILLISFVCQLLISLYVFNYIRTISKLSVAFSLKINFDKDLITTCLVSSSVILVITYLRFLLGLRSDVVINNYALVIGALPALMFDRFFEYSGLHRGRLLELAPKIFFVWVLALLAVGVMNKMNLGTVQIRSILYFFGLFPFVFLFTNYRYKKVYSIQFILICFSLLIGLLLEIEVVLTVLGLLSWLFIFYNRWQGN